MHRERSLRDRHARVTALALVLLVGCESITEQPQRVGMRASLAGGTVRPDTVATSASGSFDGILSSVPEFSYALEFAGLSSAPSAAHIHGPADTNQVAGILLDLSALPAGHTGSAQFDAASGLATGTIDLNAAITATVSGDSLHALLRAGRVYVDVHSAIHGAGELRGQIRKN